MKTLIKIKNILQQNKQMLSQKYAIQTLAVFGSYARNQQNANSDVDVLVSFSKPIGVEFIDLADEIEKIIGIKVDLVSINGIQAKYLDSIKKDLIYV